MSSDSKAASGRFGAMLRELGQSLGSLFGGKPDEQRVMTIEVLFGLLGYLAKLDSLLTSHEAEFINNMMDDLKLGVTERQIAMDAQLRGRNRQIDPTAELARFCAVHGPRSDPADQLYDALLRLAAADERLRPKERQFLETVTVELGYSPHELDERLAVLATGG